MGNHIWTTSQSPTNTNGDGDADAGEDWSFFLRLIIDEANPWLPWLLISKIRSNHQNIMYQGIAVTCI